MNRGHEESLRQQRGLFVPLGLSLFVVGPLEFCERGARDAAGLEPPVAVGLSAGAVGPSTLFRDIERTGRIDRRPTTMRLTDADELDEGAVHSLVAREPRGESICHLGFY